MGDTLLALSIPVLVCASGIWTAGETWWRRRHPAPPSPYTHQAARLAGRATLVEAEQIVDGAYTSLGTLYTGSTDLRVPATRVGPEAAGGRDRERPPAPARTSR
ncbi:hypothetical protein E6R60_35220 [Streptomyces sp. A0642]|uniref:hypothetical protein n=1 Tax=Streptomyces sp. A0642 TaxID=2563100 RepID=UPI0010A271F5|nr:hypothetical protein [Streptomyces sp. A0642]THA62940.1 hypothetical protein E6R60_35220 [Streptomyces sp. A0642]